MPLPSFVDNMLHKTGNFITKCTERTGMFLFATAAIGWALSSAAQIFCLMADKNISKEDKSFLIPQEAFDCMFNITTYAALSLPLMFGAKKWARDRYPNNIQAQEGASTLAAIAGGVVSGNIITPILRNKCSAAFKNKFSNDNKQPKLDVVSSSETPLLSLSYSKSSNNSSPYSSMNSFLHYTKSSNPYGGTLTI